jgi:6-phosphogluconolactonase
MNVELLPDAAAVATRAARFIAEQARDAVASRGRFAFAVSGGRTPWLMLEALAAEQVPWSSVHLFQVDERIAPAGHADRNLTHIQESLGERAPLDPSHLHAMPVEDADLDAAAGRYAAELRTVTGAPPVLDLVHLGLGTDGHTASLVPGDPALEVVDADVALTGPYQGRRRMTLTLPALDRARRVLWVVTGEEKAAIVSRLRIGDGSIPSGRVRAERALLLLDAAAAGDPVRGR